MALPMSQPGGPYGHLQVPGLPSHCLCPRWPLDRVSCPRAQAWLHSLLTCFSVLGFSDSAQWPQQGQVSRGLGLTCWRGYALRILCFISSAHFEINLPYILIQSWT